MRAGRKPGTPRTGGRLKGTPNKSTAEIKALAQKYTPAAMKELGRLAVQAESETARVSAIRELLDRAYGKASQPIGGADDLPPVSHELNVTGLSAQTLREIAAQS